LKPCLWIAIDLDGVKFVPPQNLLDLIIVRYATDVFSKWIITVLFFLYVGPWLSNCIGFHNQGNFLKFLFYSVLALLLLIFGIAYIPFHLKVDLSLFLEISSGFQIAIWIINASILIILFPSLILLFLQNFRMASCNITYIEQLQLDFAKKNISQKLKEKLVFPYNSNKIKDNLILTFGENILLWFLPVSGPFSLSDSDGTSFKVRPDSLSNGFWPLMEFSEKNGAVKNELGEYVVKRKV
jgi:hypothetical protein